MAVSDAAEARGDVEAGSTDAISTKRDRILIPRIIQFPSVSTFLLWNKHTFLLSNHVTPIHLGEIQEDDNRGIANRGVMAGEFEAAGLVIHGDERSCPRQCDRSF